MWSWVVRLFTSGEYEPLERPNPLARGCSGSLDDADLQNVRDIQHDADNVLTGIRGRRDFETRMSRRAGDRFNEGMRDAWAGGHEA